MRSALLENPSTFSMSRVPGRRSGNDTLNNEIVEGLYLVHSLNTPRVEGIRRRGRE